MVNLNWQNKKVAKLIFYKSCSHYPKRANPLVVKPYCTLDRLISNSKLLQIQFISIHTHTCTCNMHMYKLILSSPAPRPCKGLLQWAKLYLVHNCSQPITSFHHIAISPFRHFTIKTWRKNNSPWFWPTLIMHRVRAPL